MPEAENKMKDVLIHVGFHKTGTTAAQAFFSANREYLRSYGVDYLSNRKTAVAALQVAKGKLASAERKLSGLTQAISDSDQPAVLLSHEDFAGEMPGRNGCKTVYRDFEKNLMFLKNVMQPHDVRFVVFTRPMIPWLKSVYSQLIQYRTDYYSYEQFESDMDLPRDWNAVLSRAADGFGDKLAIFDYAPDPSSGVRHILGLLGKRDAALIDVPQKNVRPSASLIAEYERINRLAEIKSLSSVYKERARFEANLPLKPFTFDDGGPWPLKHDQVPVFGLESLNDRATARASKQSDVDDVLPWVQVDLKAAADRLMPTNVDLPDVTRQSMENQLSLLRYHLRGKSELALLNGLVISYLRRDTPFTSQARVIFHRLWFEHGFQLAYELSTRWLISSLQTFSDHGISGVQKQIGAAGYFYANMMKIYEGERSLEGRDPDGIYPFTVPSSGQGMKGMDKFKLGGTDLMLNTNAALLDISKQDRSAGIALIEFLLRVKNAQTVFSRLDQSRKHHNVNIKQFSNTWSFFDEPTD